MNRVMCLLVAVTAMVFLRFRSRLDPETSGSSHRDLWWIHQYAISPDMPEVLRHWELATLLRRYGWRTTFYASAINLKSRKFERPTTLFRPVVPRMEQGVDFLWLYSFPYQANNYRRYINMVSFLIVSVLAGMFRRGPELVIGTSPHLLAGLAGWMLAKRHRVPFILEVQDLWPESIVQLGVTNPIIVKPLERLERFLYRNSDFIITLSDGITDGVIAKGTPQEKVKLISNAAMRPDVVDQRSRDRFRIELGWAADEVIAIWVGGHGPANGLDTIVDAARLLEGERNLRLVLIGDGPEKQKLRDQASGLTIIEFWPSIPKADVPKYLQAADVGIMHSRKFAAFEGTRPCKLFDYMAASLPIMTSMPGEAGRIVRDAGSGIQADWEDPKSIADAIRDLARDAGLRQQLGTKGFEYSVAHSREDTAEDLAHCIESTVERYVDD